MFCCRVFASVALLALVSAGTLFAQRPKQYSFKIEESLPHDAAAYTQGLFFHDGQLYESTGTYGESDFRKVDLKTGRVLQRVNFDKQYFIEGSCVLKGRLYILTWQEKTCFVYDIKTLKKLGYFRCMEEGWGLTTDGTQLIMSNGTAELFFRDPDTFLIKRKIQITSDGYEVKFLNELEYINGEIWANVYGWDKIVRIDPATGKVTGEIDCTGLLARNLMKSSTDVLNGIAFDPETGYVYVTGKYWPKMYRISLVEK